MIRFREGVLAVLLVLLFAGSVAAQETIPFDPPRKATVTSANVNLRSGPGQDYPVVGGLNKQGLAGEARARRRNDIPGRAGSRRWSGSGCC